MPNVKIFNLVYVSELPNRVVENPIGGTFCTEKGFMKPERVDLNIYR
jgi:hypothetical protein